MVSQVIEEIQALYGANVMVLMVVLEKLERPGRERSVMRIRV